MDTNSDNLTWIGHSILQLIYAQNLKKKMPIKTCFMKSVYFLTKILNTDLTISICYHEMTIIFATPFGCNHGNFNSDYSFGMGVPKLPSRNPACRDALKFPRDMSFAFPTVAENSKRHNFR